MSAEKWILCKWERLSRIIFDFTSARQATLCAGSVGQSHKEAGPNLCYAWISLPGQVSPSVGHGLRRTSEAWDAVARCWLLSNTLFLLGLAISTSGEPASLEQLQPLVASADLRAT